MLPVILNLGPLAIRSYGLMLAIAFVVGIVLLIRRAKKYDIASNTILDLSLVIIVSAIAGARVFYVLFHLKEMGFLDIFSLWQGGLNLYGGLLFAIAASWIFLKIKKLPLLLISDLAAPSISIGLAVTRVGCFLNGCCFGMPTDLPWGVVFSPKGAAGMQFMGVHIHPTQLYASIFGLVAFGFLLFAERFKKFNGFLIFLFLLIYAPFRFFIEYIRYYERSMYVTESGVRFLTMNQIISICLFAFAGFMLIYLNMKNKGTQKEAEVEQA